MSPWGTNSSLAENYWSESAIHLPNSFTIVHATTGMRWFVDSVSGTAEILQRCSGASHSKSKWEE